jgi:hypothetical protein
MFGVPKKKVLPKGLGVWIPACQLWVACLKMSFGQSVMVRL